MLSLQSVPRNKTVSFNFKTNAILQKIDENNEEIKEESDVEMKVDDIQAELCIKEKSLEEIPMGNDQNTPEIIDPCNMDTANAKLENECPKVKSKGSPK